MGDTQPARTLNEEISARAAVAGVAHGVPRSERTPKVRLALASMKAEIDEFSEQISRLNQMLLQAEMRADQDSLIPIYNRRGFIREFNSFLKLSRRQEIPAWLVYFDLDGFKSINDQHGHDAGDAILKAVGDVLKKHTRESDSIGRMGGDEFIALLTHIEASAAHTKAGELAQAIQSLGVKHENHVLHIETSYGLCQLNTREKADLQIKRADSAMYKNKQTRQRLHA